MSLANIITLVRLPVLLLVVGFLFVPRFGVRLLLELAGALDLDLSQSYAYGDHCQDLPLFRSIGHPVAANPSWRLRRLAQRHRWPIRSF